MDSIKAQEPSERNSDMNTATLSFADEIKLGIPQDHLPELPAYDPEVITHQFEKRFFPLRKKSLPCAMRCDTYQSNFTPS